MRNGTCEREGARSRRYMLGVEDEGWSGLLDEGSVDFSVHKTSSIL